MKTKPDQVFFLGYIGHKAEYLQSLFAEHSYTHEANEYGYFCRFENITELVVNQGVTCWTNCWESEEDFKDRLFTMLLFAMPEKPVVESQPEYFIFFGDNMDHLYNSDLTDIAVLNELSENDDWSIRKHLPTDKAVDLLNAYTGWVGLSTLTADEFRLLSAVKKLQEETETAD